MSEFRFVKEFSMLKLCVMQYHAQGVLILHIILGVKNQSEAMAVSRYSFSGGHVEYVKAILVHVMLLLLQGFCVGSWHE